MVCPAADKLMFYVGRGFIGPGKKTTNKIAKNIMIMFVSACVSFSNFLFLVAKLLYKSKFPSVCTSVRMSTTFRGKRDFLGP